MIKKAKKKTKKENHPFNIIERQAAKIRKQEIEIKRLKLIINTIEGIIIDGKRN